MGSTEILSRVRKLLALATSPNVHEAAAAAAAAQALIDRHRLAELLAETTQAEPITDGRDAPLCRVKRLRRWKVALACSLAEINGGLAYTMEMGGETALLFAGRAEDRAAVAALWEWLVEQLQWLSATHGAGKSRDWHEAFRIGAAEVVAARLAAPQASDRPEAPGEGAMTAAGLVLLEQDRRARAAAVEAFAEEKLRLKPGRSMRVDLRGLERGREAGAALPLPPRRR